MQFKKTVKVQCNETVTVSRYSRTGRIFLEVDIDQDDFVGSAYVILTPKQVRKVRKALKRALQHG